MQYYCISIFFVEKITLDATELDLSQTRLISGQWKRIIKEL